MPRNRIPKKGTVSNTFFTAAIYTLFALAIFLRYKLIPFTNYDTDGYIRWYDFIVKTGIPDALGLNFSIYTPPYLYLLSMATVARNVIPKLIAIKLIPIVFDLINAVTIFKILRLKHKSGRIPHFGALVFLLAPTIIANSAFWGQIDSIYSCFLLMTVYFMLTDKPARAMIAFGLAISIKAQAAFLGPALLIWALKKRITWKHFLLTPLTYVIVMLPAILAGRALLDVLTVYLNQASELQILSHNAPNWYIFFQQASYPIIMPAGMVTTALIVGVWVYINWQKQYPLTNEEILLLSLMATAITPFFLPKMHDRYFYPADVFSIVLALYTPRFWFVPIVYQIVSGLAYSVFLFNAPRSIVLVLATELNTLIIAYLIWKHAAQLKKTHISPNNPP